MTKPRPSLLSRTLQNLRSRWQRRQSRDRFLDRRPRFEFLESRQMLHGGHDHGEGEDPDYDFNSNFHIHYQLDIVVNGDQQLIPKGVGNNVGANSGKFHTHDFTGLIHVHPGPIGRFVTVDDFFNGWRTDTVLGNASALFSSSNILGNAANGTHTVRMYVNGALNTEFQNYEIHDGDKIVISYEPIANTDFPSFEPIANQSLLGGAPLWLALDGLDPNGGTINYSVSVANPSGQPSLVTATIPTGNRKMVIDVEGFGKMTFELADDLAPNVVNEIVELINAGFYNRSVLNQTVQGSPAATSTSFAGSSSLSSANDFYNGQEVLFTSGALTGQRARIVDYVGSTRQFTFASGAFTAAPAAGDSFQVIREIIFHRVVPNFVIQAGDPSATGAGGSGQPDFNDQYNLKLQFTSPGLLAMAKSSDDTNDSQWFITDATPRFLDFNHSIWGRLIDGEEVRDLINSVPTTSDKPNTPVVINSIQIVTDNENASIRLEAAEGASGQASVTVTATDPQGHAFSRTFQVTVTPDTANSAPFLVNPTNVTGVAGQPIQLQLQAVDAEGDANFFDAAKPAGETVNYTLNVNNSTGLVTITPPTGFQGTFKVIVGVRGATQTTTNDQFDTQEVTVSVGPAAPTGIDLLAVSDSGDSNTDNITNAGTLQFTVSGVSSGALVKIMKGTNVLAQGTATGTTINLSTTNLGLLGDGVHGLTATQTLNDVESAASPVLNVTLDTTPPAAFTSTPPTEADVNVLLTYDAQNPGEGTAGFKYQLVTPPTGVSINPTTGVLTWTPASAQLGLQSFGVTAVDAAGNVRTQTLNITVDEAVPPKAEFLLRLIDSSGAELTGLATGQDFFLQVFGADLRTPGRGMFAGYLDIEWDSAKALVTGPIQFAAPYAGQQSGTGTPGLLDDVGAFAGTSETGSGFKEIFRVPMRATAGGNLIFSGDPADVFPAHETLLYGDTAGLDLEEIRFGTASITVNATFEAVNDTFNFNEDSQNNSVTPLTNDTSVGGATNVLTISAVGSTSNGGTVTIAADGKSLIYTPAPNFFGTETFTYTAKNQNDETATATVTIQVQPQNDPPSAVNDTFNVERNANNISLDVMANDSFAPDTGETLRVTAVGAGSQGGSITLGNNGTNVRYTPKPNFSGTETFTYTIRDRATGGLTAQATVTVNVTSANPTAVPDTATAVEDATTPIVIDVLANDLLGDGTSLTITAVSAGSKGGTITITQSGTRVNYTPAANAQGVESFTYTVSNGIGTATGAVSVTITNSNDPPVAVADTVTGFKNTTTTFDLLANDTTGPDPGENLVIDSVTQPANGSVQIVESGKKVSFTPTNNFTGTTTFTYTIKDPGGLTAGPVTVTVNVQEFAPSSLAGSVYFDANNDGIRGTLEVGIGGVTITLTGTDVNSAAINRTVETAPDGSYKFDNLLPGTNYVITQTHPAFTIDGKETAGTSGGTTTTNERISAINLPQGTQATGYNFGERGRQTSFVNAQGQTVPLVTIRDFFTSNYVRDSVIVAVNASGSELWHTNRGTTWDAYSALSFDVQGTPATIHINAVNGTAQPQSAQLPVTHSQVRLIGTQSGNQLYQIRTTPSALNFQTANQAPAAAADSFTTAEDTALNIAAPGLLTNDSDPDGTSLTAVIVTQPTHGTLTLNANGSFTYTPAANYNGPDSFTYRASDGTATSSPATVSLTVTAVNDTPVAANDTFTTPFNTALTPAAPGVLSNDTDVDTGTTLTPTVVAQPLHGTVTLNANGSFSYTPTTGYSGPDSFTYRVSDGTANSTAATVNITVQPDLGEGEATAADAAMLSFLDGEEPSLTSGDDWIGAVDEVLAELG